PFAVAHDAGFDPDPWQSDLIEAADDQILLNVSRQGGKSTATSVLAVNTALTDPGLILAASPSQRQSGELFRKILATLRAVKSAPAITSLSATQIELENGARI